MTGEEFAAEAKKRLQAKGATEIETFADDRILGAICTFRGKRMEASFLRGGYDEKAMSAVLKAIDKMGSTS